MTSANGTQMVKSLALTSLDRHRAQLVEARESRKRWHDETSKPAEAAVYVLGHQKAVVLAHLFKTRRGFIEIPKGYASDYVTCAACAVQLTSHKSIEEHAGTTGHTAYTAIRITYPSGSREERP